MTSVGVRPSNGLAVAGFVLGVVAVALAAVPAPVLWFMGLVPAVLAVVFGAVGVATAKRNGGLYRGFAVWSVALGALAIVGPWLLVALTGLSYY